MKDSRPDPKSAPEASGDGSVMSDSGNIDQIRDILFGRQMDDYQQRFKSVEKQLAREAHALKDSINKRFESLRALMEKKIGQLDRKIEKEAQKRRQDQQSLSETLTAADALLQKALDQFADEVNTRSRERHQKVAQQLEALFIEIDQRSKDAAETLAQAQQHLQTDKISLTDLSRLLADLSKSVADINTPGEGSADDTGKKAG